MLSEAKVEPKMKTLPFHLRIIWKAWPLNGQISFQSSSGIARRAEE